MQEEGEEEGEEAESTGGAVLAAQPSESRGKYVDQIQQKYLDCL